MAVGYFYSNRERLSANDLAMANVEAIASGETDSEGKIDCYSSFVDKDSGSYNVKDCGTCMSVDCSDYSDKGKCKK